MAATHYPATEKFNFSADDTLRFFHEFDSDLDPDTEEADYETIVATPLHLAAFLGRNNIIEYFLSLDPEAINNRLPGYGTPLICATSAHRASTVALLIKRGADVIQRDGDGETALHIAITKGQADIVILLAGMRKHPMHERSIYPTGSDDPNVVSDYIFTPLEMAVRANREDLVELLLHFGADPTVHGNFGTVLYIAQSARVVGLILDKVPAEKVKGFLEIRATSRDSLRATALLCQEDSEIVKALLKAGADFEARTYGGDGDTALARLARMDWGGRGGCGARIV